MPRPADLRFAPMRPLHRLHGLRSARTAALAPAVSAAMTAAALLFTAGAQAQAPARVNDFPTLDRVMYVQECMRQHPGSTFEMTSKCVCAVDRIAEEVSYDDYAGMSTSFNANSIGGERGNSIRDAESLQDQIKRFRALQAKVKKACFLTP